MVATRASGRKKRACADGRPITRAILRATLAVAHAPPGAVLQAVCQELKRACGARYVCIHLVHPELLGLAPTDAVLTQCPACDLHPSDRPRLAAAEHAFFTRALERRAPLEVVDCVGVVPHLAELARATGFRNGLAVPLAYRAEVFGLVGSPAPEAHISSPHPRRPICANVFPATVLLMRC